MKNIKAVFIDIDDTLLDFVKCSDESMLKAAEDFNIDFPDNYYSTFKKVNDGLWHEIEQKKIDIPGLRKVRWCIIFKELGIDFDGVKFEERFYSYLTESAVTVENAVETVKYLSGKYKVYAASNAPANQQQVRLGKAGIIDYLDGIFVSEEMGASKPSKFFFDACFGKIGGIQPDETVMVGDSVTADIIGAKAYGMNTVLLNRTDKLKFSSQADYVIDSLTKLKDIL